MATQVKTIRELYKWAEENNVLDIPIGVQYQDDGGSYIGDTFDNCWSNYYGVSVSTRKKTGLHSHEVVNGKYRMKQLPDVPYVLIE